MNDTEQNWSAFSRRYPVLSKNLKKKGNSQDKKVWSEIIQNDEKVIALERENRTWYLNSRLDPNYAAQIYSERYPSRVYETYIVFGFGDGKHVRKLMDKCDETNQIIVYEPDARIFMEAMNNFPLKDLIEDPRIIICILEDNENIIDITANANLSFCQVDLVEYCILPGYDVLFPEQCKKTIDEILNRLLIIRAEKATDIHFKREKPQHILYHMKNMISECNYMQIKDKLEKISIKDIPAIIVSAGPSLDKNVKELKRAEGKSMIIAVDGALRTLMNNKIQPDIAVSIDAKVPKKFFEDVNIKEMNWICTSVTRPWILQEIGGKPFYCGGFSEEWDRAVEEEVGYKIPPIEIGGSVTSAAFTIAISFGFKKIILVGQDMAFTGGKSHTGGVSEAIGDNDQYIKSRARVMVEGIDGKMLETDMQMLLYKRWFEKKIESLKGEITVINATEGGARIQGAENRSLSDVIDEDCKIEVDLYDLIHEMEPPLEQKKRENLYEKLSDMKIQMLKLKDKIRNAIESITKMRDEYYSANEDAKKIKEILIKLRDLNEEINKDRMLSWIQMYAVEEEHNLLGNIYKNEEMKEGELIEKTLHLYEAYYQKTDLFFEDYENYAI